MDHVAKYQPGRFVARELPPIAALLAQAGRLDLVVLDGYVDLAPSGRPSLGRYLHAQIGVPVIGVAKTAFRSAEHAIAVRRGTAIRPAGHGWNVRFCHGARCVGAAGHAR